MLKFIKVALLVLMLNTSGSGKDTAHEIKLGKLRVERTVPIKMGSLMRLLTLNAQMESTLKLFST